VASQFQWHKCYGTLRPSDNTKKLKAPEETLAKTGICDSDCSDDTDSEFQGSSSWAPNDRTLRLHVPKDIKQEKHQRDEKVSISPAKKAKSVPFEVDEFYFDNEIPMEDFDGYNPDLKVSPNRVMNPVTKIEMKPSTLKEDDKVKEKEESEEPPKWFLVDAVVVGRIEKQ
jgi:hypothetical protein